MDGHISYLAEHEFILGGLLNGGVKWNTLDKSSAAFTPSPARLSPVQWSPKAARRELRNVPGSNIFFIDPAFLNYTSTPIEITTVVRRNEANDNTGFKLVYESTTGLKTAKSDWFTVPDNK